MPRPAKAVLIAIGRVLGPLAYDRNYLKGRHFGRDGRGWRWVMAGLLWQKLFGFNRHVPWPMTPFSRVTIPANLIFHPDDINNFQSPGCYFQNAGARITIGRGTYIAPNVGIITSNHDPSDPAAHLPSRDISIGENCWIGMNSVLLPGVILGASTVVGAGAVVTKSFPEGHCIIGGVPARVLRSNQVAEELRGHLREGDCGEA